MLKRMKANWKQTFSGLLAALIVIGMLPSMAFAADMSPTYASTRGFELNVAGATVWNGGSQPLPVYDSETGGTQITAIPAAVPFALLEDNGEDRLKIGYVEDGGWNGSQLDGTGWADKGSILVNLPDVLPSIVYDRDTDKQFNSRLTRFEYIIPCLYTLAEQLAQLQKEAMSSGETLVVRMDSQTVTVSRAKGGPAQLHSYRLDGAVYEKYDVWTEYDVPDADLTALDYELPYPIERAYSADPSITLADFCPQTHKRTPAGATPTSDIGAHNPGSPGGSKPSTTNVAWSTDPERTFLRFTLIGFPAGVVTDIGSNDYSNWHVVGTPLNVVWSKGSSGAPWSVEKCRSDITWYNSCAMQFNGKGSSAPELMGDTVYSYDATSGSNQNWVTTADEFQAETGITDEQKEQMFHCNSDSWSSGWIDGDYTSMWGSDPQPVTPDNLYKVYKANDTFLYLLGRLSGNDSSPSWSADEAIERWSEHVHDTDGNLRTKYRIIVETGGIFRDPDGVCRAYTLREAMAYSLYNNEGTEQYTLLHDQSGTLRNMSRWMRQAKDNQFVEFPLDENGVPTGEELHSTNGFLECDSYVDTVQYARPIRDTIFSERRSFGLHIFSPFNFESTPASLSLEVTKQAGDGIPAGEEWGFTINYTSGAPTSYNATKSVIETEKGLKFVLKAGEKIHIDFEATPSFRFEVTEDDSSKLTGITGTGGAVDMTAKKFSSSGGASKVTFTNGTVTTPPPDDPPPTPTSGTAILYKRDANTNAGVGPATFKFSSVTNGDYEFDTDASGALETIQWWDPTEAEGRYIKPGEYAVSELIPPPNYMPTTEVQQIRLELDADGNPIPAGPLVFKNQAKAGLKIVKYDRQSHSPMNGVIFEIYRDGISIGRYETKGGEIVLTNIEPGTYRAVEVDTGDEGHILDTSYQEVELVAGGGTKELVFFNDNKPGLKLVKVDSADPSKTISGAKFSVRAVDGSYGPQEFVTNGSGEIDLSMLPEGSYEVTELECAGYVIDNAQRMIHLRANDTAEFVFTNTKKPGFRLIKTSADGTPLDGVTFRIAKIEDGSRYLDRTTRSGGEIFVEDLEPGVWSVQEISTLPDHILDATEYHVELFPGKVSTITLENHKRPNLYVYKNDADDGTPIEHTIFTVRAADGHSVDEIETDSTGRAVLENVLPGVYEISEKSVPSPWLKDAPSQLVTLYPDRDHTAYFENHKRPVIEIIKENAVTFERLAHVPFQVWYASNTSTGEFNDLGVFYTDENGRIVLTEPDIFLRDGWFRVKELEAPNGFALADPDTQEAFIPSGTSHTFVFRNRPLSAICVWKYDSVSPNMAIEGAVFQIRYLSGNTSGTGGTVIGTYRTGGNGSFTATGLPAGAYIIEELSSDGDHVIDTPPQTVYLSGDDQEVIQVHFGNSPKGSLLVKKMDSVSKQPLSDVEFLVTDSKGNVIGDSNGKFVTDSTGSFTVSGIDPSTTLIVKEVKAKDGYIMDDVPQTATINAGQTVTLEFRNQPLGSLLIRKVCSVNPSVTLPNAEFKVAYSDGTLIGDSNGVYRSDENGEVRIEGLIPGKSVVITETKAPAGFLIDTQSQTIVIQAGKTVTITMKNQPRGQLIIQKRDSQTNQVLSGAQFRITTAAGCEVGLDGVIGTAALTQNGIFTTDSQGEIRITNLAPGGYVLSEIKAPDGGYVIDNPSTNVVIGTNGDTQTVVITNTRKGNLIVEKYDSVTKQPLAGAQFKISTASGELVSDNEGVTSTNGLYTTGSDGRIVLSKINPQTYLVVEGRSPDNYQADPTPQTVVVNAGDTQTVRFYNDPLCTLTLLKRDSVTKKPLKGAEFLVRDSSGQLIGPNNGIYTTGTDGTVTVSGLTPDSTILVSEYKAPTGYVKDETPKNIVVRTGVANSLIFDDEPATTLIIQKFIEGTENEPLSGVAFKVTDGAGAAVGPDDGVYYSDKAGEIVLDGIEPGTTVKVREIKTVDGFVLDGTPQDILIKAGEVQRLTFWNKRAGTLLIEKLDSVTKAPLAGAQFKVLYADGRVVDTEGGRLSSNGIYVTDSNGQIKITNVTGTLVVTEEKCPDGYVLGSNDKSQTVVVNPQDTQTLHFYNDPMCSLTLTKLDAVTGKPVPNTEFTLKDGDGNILGRYTTGADGTVTATGLIPNSTVVVVESKVPSNYVLDPTPHTIIVRNGSNSVSTGTTSSGSPTVGGSGDSGTGGNNITVENVPKVTLTIEKYLETESGEKPLKGVTFLVTDQTGAVVGGSNGEYTSDETGRIIIPNLEPGTTVTAREISVPDGVVLDSTPKSILIKAGEQGQTLRFVNKAEGGLELIKVSESDKSKRIEGVTFEIRRMGGGLVDTITTGDNGRVFLPMDAGDFYAVEIEAAKGFRIDNTPHYFTIRDGKTTTLTVTNAPFSGIILHKVDSVSGDGIYDVKFLVYDENKNPIGEYATDDRGYIYIDDLTVQGKGRLYIRELESAPGYELDKEYKTVYVQPGKTVEIEWENTPITGQIQVMKYAGEYNEVTGTPAGTPLKGAVYEISDPRSNKVVDYITTDARGIAASRPLPLGRYKIVEVTTPAYWQLSGTVFDVTLEYSGQIIKVSDYDKPANLKVTITKTGNKQLLAGDSMRYDLTVSNNSNVALENFFWHDRFPTDCATAKTITTGTYNARLHYQITYKTNYNGYRVLAANLLSTNNYAFNLTSIPLMQGEVVTDVRLEFGKVPASFASVTKPTVTVQTRANLANGYQLVNRADAGGRYMSQWETGNTVWITLIIKFNQPNLPKTGY